MRGHLTYAEYLELEQRTGMRHEYLDGEAWMMAGGTMRHSAVKVNLVGALFTRLRGRPCRIYDSDLKTIVPPTGLATYADVAVICGSPQAAALDRHAATNPVALFEVLSGSTEAWDRGGKFHHYRHLDSLQHYVLVSVHTSRVEVYSRGPDGTWVLREHGAGQTFSLPAVEVELPVDELYLDMPDEAEADPASPARPSG